MNKRSNLIGLLVFCALGLGAWAFWSPAASAVAASEKSHAGHDHDAHDKKAAPASEKALGDLFEEDEKEKKDDHEGHGHKEKAAKADAHEGHEHGSEGSICPEHKVPEEQDALCHGDHLGDLQPGQGMLVRLADGEVAGKTGVSLSAPEWLLQDGGAAIPGRVEFNRDRFSQVSPPAAGVVREVRVRPGARVKKGELLAQLAMPEMGSLKAGLLGVRAREIQAESAWRREKDLLDRGISARQEFEQAEADYRAAQSATQQYRQQLLSQGMSAAGIDQLLRSGDSSALVPLVSPLSGRVVEVRTAAGEAAVPGTPLFVLADLDTLWVELSVPESRIFEAEEGAGVEVRFTGLPGKVFTGRIFQSGASLDERTRTLKVLAEVQNPGERLKAGMFGEVRIAGAARGKVSAVPASALQTIDGQPYVFIHKEADLFELRRVSIGAKAGGLIPVLDGLSGKEQVVSGQGFALKSEVLKARLGASCADH